MLKNIYTYINKKVKSFFSGLLSLYKLLNLFIVISINIYIRFSFRIYSK